MRFKFSKPKIKQSFPTTKTWTNLTNIWWWWWWWQLLSLCKV